MRVAGWLAGRRPTKHFVMSFAFIRIHSAPTLVLVLVVGGARSVPVLGFRGKGGYDVGGILGMSFEDTFVWRELRIAVRGERSCVDQ